VIIIGPPVDIGTDEICAQCSAPVPRQVQLKSRAWYLWTEWERIGGTDPKKARITMTDEQLSAIKSELRNISWILFAISCILASILARLLS
jgi:hypothetical protein